MTVNKITAELQSDKRLLFWAVVMLFVNLVDCF